MSEIVTCGEFKAAKIAERLLIAAARKIDRATFKAKDWRMRRDLRETADALRERASELWLETDGWTC